MLRLTSVLDDLVVNETGTEVLVAPYHVLSQTLARLTVDLKRLSLVIVQPVNSARVVTIFKNTRHGPVLALALIARVVVVETLTVPM